MSLFVHLIQLISLVPLFYCSHLIWLRARIPIHMLFYRTRLHCNHLFLQLPVQHYRRPTCLRRCHRRRLRRCNSVFFTMEKELF